MGNKALSTAQNYKDHDAKTAEYISLKFINYFD